MTDLRLLLSPHPHTLDIGPRAVTVRAASALEWLTALADPRFVEHVIPGMLEPADAVAVLRGLAAEDLTTADLVAGANAALGAAAGMSWWKAVRLAQWAASGYWGALVLRGVDPGRLSLAAWCAAVYEAVQDGRDETGRLKVDMALDVPPAGETDLSAWAVDTDALGL